MRILLLAAALLLSGCDWTSTVRLYTPTDAAHPIAPGRYRASGGRPIPPIARVTVQADGMTRVSAEEPGSEVTLAGFVALDDAGRRFLVWAVGPEPDSPALYGLAERAADGDWLIYVPSCEGRNAEVAVAAGGRAEADGSRRTCVFETRQAMENAMRRAVITPDRLLTRLTRIDG